MELPLQFTSTRGNVDCYFVFVSDLLIFLYNAIHVFINNKRKVTTITGLIAKEW